MGRYLPQEKTQPTLTTPLLPNAGARRSRLLPLLICLAQRVVQSLDSLNLARPLCPLRLIVQESHQVGKRLALKELVVLVVQGPLLHLLVRLPALYPEHLLEDLNVVRDREQVAAVLIRKEIVELAESGPRDAAEAQAAWLMGCKEDAIAARVGRVAGSGKSAVKNCWMQLISP